MSVSCATLLSVFNRGPMPRGRGMPPASSERTGPHPAPRPHLLGDAGQEAHAGAALHEVAVQVAARVPAVVRVDLCMARGGRSDASGMAQHSQAAVARTQYGSRKTQEANVRESTAVSPPKVFHTISQCTFLAGLGPREKSQGANKSP